MKRLFFDMDNAMMDFLSGFDKGERIEFGSEKFPDWNTVVNYLLNK